MVSAACGAEDFYSTEVKWNKMKTAFPLWFIYHSYRSSFYLLFFKQLKLLLITTLSIFKICGAIAKMFNLFNCRSMHAAPKVLNWPENWTIDRQRPGLVIHISTLLTTPPILKQKLIVCLNLYVKNWVSILAIVCWEHHENWNFWVWINHLIRIYLFLGLQLTSLFLSFGRVKLYSYYNQMNYVWTDANIHGGTQTNRFVDCHFSFSYLLF